MEVNNTCAPRLSKNTTVPKDLSVCDTLKSGTTENGNLKICTETGSTIVSEGDTIVVANKDHFDIPCSIFAAINNYRLCIDSTINPQAPNILSLPNFPNTNETQVYKDPSISGFAFFANQKGYDITNIHHDPFQKQTGAFNTTYLALCDSPIGPPPEPPAGPNSNGHHGPNPRLALGLGLGLGLPALLAVIVCVCCTRRIGTRPRAARRGPNQEFELRTK